MRRTALALMIGICLAAGALGLPPAAARPKMEHNHTEHWNQVPSRKWQCIYAAEVTGCFAPHSEYFSLRDEMADGWAVVIAWELGKDRQGQIWNLYGKKGGRTYENKSFPENRTLSWQVCIAKHGEPILQACTTPKKSTT